MGHHPSDIGQITSDGAVGAVPPPEPGDDAARAIAWDALIHDTGAIVFVVDGEGVVQWMNGVGREAFETSQTCIGTGGVTLQSIMPAPVAEERLEHIRRCLETGETTVMQGMCWGELRRTTLRPLASEDGGPPSRVLSTCTMTTRAFAPACLPTRMRAEDRGVLDQLTEREVEVLTLIAKGLTTQQVADELGRSVKTVEWHRLSLGNKLGVSNRVELAQIAIRAGLVALS